MKPHTSLFAAALLAAAVPAQDNPAPGRFVFEAGEVAIDDLVNRCATFLEVNILIDPRECAAAPPLRLQKPIVSDRDNCLDVLASLLFRSQFALTVVERDPDVYEAIMLTGSRGREVSTRAERKTVEEVLARPRLCMPIMTTIQLEHVNAQVANNTLRPFFAANSSPGPQMLTIGNVGNESSLILQGMQNQVAQAIELIRSCDVEQKPNPMEQALEQRLQALEARVAQLEKLLQSRADKK